MDCPPPLLINEMKSKFEKRVVVKRKDHSDVVHGDSYVDIHSDVHHRNGHGDVAHGDIAHTDTHGDIAHGDAYNDHTDIPE